MVGKKMKLPKQVEEYSGFVMVGVLVLLFFCMRKKRIVEGADLAEDADSDKDPTQDSDEDPTQDSNKDPTQDPTQDPDSIKGGEEKIGENEDSAKVVESESEGGADVVVESDSGADVIDKPDDVADVEPKSEAEGFMDYPW